MVTITSSSTVESDTTFNIDIGSTLYIPFMAGAWTVVQGTWANVTDSNVFFFFFIDNTTHAINDEILIPVYLEKGTYQMQFWARQHTDEGITSIYLNTTKIGDYDAYNVAATNNNLRSETGITVSASGIYNLRIICSGKNASSSQYRSYLQNGIYLTRTA